MKIIKVNKVKDCLDGTFIKEVILSNVITKDLILFLGKDGDLQYFTKFARPFFKIDIFGIYQLKGIEGNNRMQIILSRKNIDEAFFIFKKKIENFHDK